MTSRRVGQVNSWRLREHQPGEVQADFLEERAEARGGVAAAAGYQHLQSLVLFPRVLGSLSCWAALKQEPLWPGDPGFFPATYSASSPDKCQHGGRDPSSIERLRDAEPLFQDADRAGGRGEGPALRWLAV